MRILMIGNFGNSWDGSICDELHIATALEELGHEVVQLQREKANHDDIDIIGPFDFILIAQWNGYPKHICSFLKGFYNCPVVYWAFDYQWDSGEEWHFEMAIEADLFLSKEMNNRTDYEDLGVNFRWLPQDFAPKFLSPTVKEYPEYDVTFTGSYLPQAEFRNTLLKRIDDDHNFDLHIFTVTPDGFAGFKNVHPPVMDDGLPELYAKSRVVLSIDWKQAEGYWSDRMSQALACGAYVVNKFVPMQELDYPDVAHFNTEEECLELLKKTGETGQKPIYVTDRVKQMLLIVKEIL